MTEPTSKAKADVRQFEAFRLGRASPHLTIAATMLLVTQIGGWRRPPRRVDYAFPLPINQTGSLVDFTSPNQASKRQTLCSNYCNTSTDTVKEIEVDESSTVQQPPATPGF